MKNLVVSLFAGLTLLCSSANTQAENVSYDLLASSPVGSWQLREDIDTNKKGKQTGTTVRSSIVGIETRNDEKHYWLEMAIDTFKIKKNGKRKKKGKRAIVKSLIAESMMKGDPANIINNLRGFGVETIIQNGNEDPMRMRNTGALATSMMQSLGTEIKYDFEDLGQETVTVKAGEFDAQKIRGLGNVEMKILFKKIKVESDTTQWISSKVPFGIVKSEGTTITNGKTSTQTSELLEFGMTGAVSEITKEPQDMPEIPDLGGLLGN